MQGKCIVLIVLCISPVLAQRVAPARVQAKLFSKLLAFYTNLGTEDFTIHVVDAPSVAKELKKLVGTKIGNATLGGVSSGSEAPENGAKVVYLGKKNESVIQFARQSKVLTITGNPSLVKQGVTLGLGLDRGKTKIMLNLSTSKEEGIVWNPAILRVAERVN